MARSSLPSFIAGHGGCPREGGEREAESLFRGCAAAGGGDTCKRRVTPADLPLKSHFWRREAADWQSRVAVFHHEVKADRVPGAQETMAGMSTQTYPAR